MADKREKVISYRRANWFNDHPETINLGLCISLTASKLPAVKDRTVSRDDQELKLAALQIDPDKGHLLHITIETPGDFASVVPAAPAAAEAVEVSTIPPPNNAEYMDGDAFVYVLGNDVCLCTTGCTDSTIRWFLAELFNKANIRKDADQFELIKAASMNKISMLNSIGVKEIILKGTIFAASAHYLKRKGQPAGLLSELSRVFKSDLGTPNDGNEDALNIAVTLTLDKRRKGITIGEDRLKKTAERAINSAEPNDDFVIVLLDGQQITPDEIYVKTEVLIESHGKSVVKPKAWNELKAFYAKLKASGALDV